MTTCKERSEHIFPKNEYQLRQTLFDKLDSFGIRHTDNQKLFENMAIFDFESTCEEDEKLKDTETTKWIGKPIAMPVWIISNLIQEPIFFCDPSRRDLVATFIDAWENLATQSKAEMKKKLPSN